VGRVHLKIRNRYDNFIGGAWVPPVKGQYFENRTPISGEVVCMIARSTAEDIEKALDAAPRGSPWVGKDGAGRARRIVVENRRPHGSEPRRSARGCSSQNTGNGRWRAAGLRPCSRGSACRCRLSRRWRQYAAENIIPVTLELGGKSPNVFFADVIDQDDDFFDKALEGFSMFALNQGEVCTCPSRALIQESIYDAFMERALERVKKVVQGNPLDPNTMVGAQASSDQFEKILSYISIGRDEGAKVLTGGKKADIGSGFENGYYVEPTVFKGHNKMRIFQEEIFGPVVAVTTFKSEAEALSMANDTLYGLGAGVWTRNISTAYRMGRGTKAGRVWTNCYHVYPAHAAFGGYKQSGIGRESHKMMLDHYQQTKNMLVSYSPKALGFF
jgi:acyl-CoA reductase-like NAD-dependent aldehyde dehydrogenase